LDLANYGMSKPTCNILEPTEIHVGQCGVRMVRILESGVWLAWDEKKHRAHTIHAQELSPANLLEGSSSQMGSLKDMPSIGLQARVHWQGDYEFH